MAITALLTLTLLITSHAAALEVSHGVQPRGSSWTRQLLQSSKTGTPTAPTLPDRDPAVRLIASAVSQYAAFQYYPPSILPHPRFPSRTLPPRIAFLAKYILGRSPSQAQGFAAAAADSDPNFIQTLRQEASETSSKEDAGGSSRLKVHEDENVPGWGAFPDASDLQAWLQAKQDAAAAVQLQQQLGSSLPKGGSVHRVLVEDDGAAAGNQQQQQQGRLRWVVLYITMPKGGKPQVEYWGAWRSAARAEQIKELVSDGRE